jgi:hypothetical protein
LLEYVSYKTSHLLRQLAEGWRVPAGETKERGFPKHGKNTQQNLRRDSGRDRRATASNVVGDGAFAALVGGGAVRSCGLHNGMAQCIVKVGRYAHGGLQRSVDGLDALQDDENSATPMSAIS